MCVLIPEIDLAELVEFGLWEISALDIYNNWIPIEPN